MYIIFSFCCSTIEWAKCWLQSVWVRCVYSTGPLLTSQALSPIFFGASFYNLMVVESLLFLAIIWSKSALFYGIPLVNLIRLKGKKKIPFPFTFSALFFFHSTKEASTHNFFLVFILYISVAWAKFFIRFSRMCFPCIAGVKTTAKYTKTHIQHPYNFWSSKYVSFVVSVGRLYV